MFLHTLTDFSRSLNVVWRDICKLVTTSACEWSHSSHTNRILITIVEQGVRAGVRVCKIILWCYYLGIKQHCLINNVQNKACNFLIGVCGHTNNIAAHSDMGWHSATSQQHAQVFRMWLSLNSRPPSSQCRIIHELSLKKKVHGRKW